MKNKLELRSALDALQVGKPFKLNTTAPSFKAPAPLKQESTAVANQTPVVNTTKVGFATQVPDETQVNNSTPVQNLAPVENQPQVAIATPVIDHTQVELQPQVIDQATVVNTARVTNTTQVGNQTQASNQTWVQDEVDHESAAATLTRRAIEQDSSVVLESRAVDSLEKGYTRLPNSILMQLANGDFTRNEIKLVLIIARFTISYQRKQAPLSKTVLERRTGMRGAAVLEALAGLVAKGIVEKTQGDQHRPNQLGLVLPDGWDCVPKKGVETTEHPSVIFAANSVSTQGPKRTAVENQTPVRNQTPAPVEIATPAGVGNPTYFKDSNKYLNKNSLSQLPDPLQKYFTEIKPAKKKESEWKAFQEIKTEYSIESISDCLVYVSEHGIGSGENTQPCHSPMAFLSKAIDTIMPEIEIHRRKQQDKFELQRAEDESRRLRDEEEARESAEWVAKETAFLKAFPDENEQQVILAELLQGLPFRPHTTAGRVMGIGRWWEGLAEK